MKFYPYKKGSGKSFSHAEGGHNKFCSNFNTGAGRFFHTEEGHNTFPFFKKGGGGDAKGF